MFGRGLVGSPRRGATHGYAGRYWPPPRFNEHGEAVLRARGFSDDEIAALARDGVLVTQRRR